MGAVAVSGNTYRHTALGFEITKPDCWAFLPSRWMVELRSRVQLDEKEFAEALRLAQVPFVSFLFDHGRRDQAVPTAQATCRPLHASTRVDRVELLCTQLEQLGRMFPDLRVMEATPRGIVAGHPANVIKARFTVRHRDGSTLRCRMRSYTILDRGLAFTVGLTGPEEGRLRCDAEFERIAASIRLR